MMPLLGIGMGRGAVCSAGTGARGAVLGDSDSSAVLRARVGSAARLSMLEKCGRGGLSGGVKI